MENERNGDVEKLKASLSQLPEPVVNPALIIVSGLPGTGKSYFSRKLAERLPLAILETDALRKTLFPSPTYSARENLRLFQVCHRLIEDLLRRGTRIVFDATNLVEHHRERLYKIAERLGAKLIIVRVEAPSELVQRRLKVRSVGSNPQNHSEADWQVYERMRPGVQRIRRNHFAVDTSRDITPVVDKIVRELRKP